MRRSRFLVIGLLGLALAVPTLAQVPTGTLSGRATDGVQPLPGVTVSVTSPNLQGARTAVTSVNGDYIFRFLPPGEYRVRFELSGFQTVEASMRISAAQSAQLDAEMPLARLEEEITVTGSYETVSTTSTASTTFDKDFIESLPVGRDIMGAVTMSPGVHSTGPGGNPTISGAQSYENLYMVNGVVVNENIRGQATGLFIEDAIQETTTSTSGISAEYGRFAGGVVNVLTKSGGNEFSGSLRLNLDNDKWTAKTPLTVSRADELNQIWEGTLGGFILKDRLWFFLAGRDWDFSEDRQTAGTFISYPSGLEETRYEGKLTFSATASHRLVGSYVERDRVWSNYHFPPMPPVDLTQIYDRSIPETLLAVNYTGVLTDSFFIEGQYSERKLTFKDSGSRFTDLIRGTPIENIDWWGGNSPWFCGVCDDEKRDNREYLVKASYFLSSQDWGTHDIVVGFTDFADQLLSNNHQSGSGFSVETFDFIFDGPNWYPVLEGGTFNTWIYWWPIPELSKGSEFTMQSLFVNDRWRLNNNWSFNLGLRYDKNDGRDALGATVSKDSGFSPRLGASFDPSGDGRWIFNASYGQYVTTLANTGNVGNASPGGNPSTLLYLYDGPDINVGDGPYTAPADALEILFDWFFNTYGGTANTDLLFVAVFRGYNRLILDELKSPYAEEISLGVVHRLGTRGLIRLDYTNRQFKNLYENQLNQATGQVEVNVFGQNWGLQDLAYTTNSSYLNRKYDGVNLQVNYRLDRFDIGGNYTWSHARGNWDGETSGSGPIASTNNPNYYPEYSDVSWSNPRGLLGIHQRHKVRTWLVWNAVNTRYHRVSLGLMQNFFSGTTYSAVGTIDTRPWVTNPGYRTPPSNVSYYFSGRGAFTTDDVTRTDLSVNYSFLIPAFGTNMEFFLQPRVTNVFNEKAVVGPNATVLTHRNRAYLSNFNPWETQPVEGVHWEKGANFGKPLTPGAYQHPRTYTVSFGVRF